MNVATLSARSIGAHPGQDRRLCPIIQVTYRADQRFRPTRAIGLLLEQAIAAGEIRGDISSEDLLRAIVGMCYTRSAWLVEERASARGHLRRRTAKSARQTLNGHKSKTSF
jgi:hypothetical protein